MVHNKRINVRLTDKEIQFLETIGADLYHTDSIQETMRSVFLLQLREDMELYEREMEETDVFID